ncbi:hypothetical protein K438DRAFT_1929741 [Mycena galopus ATCC 62051]|nr:hypothetical protein K438DRAFT_1929741 [Mycena galopus ATCC 62051]
MIQEQLRLSRDAPLDILLDWTQLRPGSVLEASFTTILTAILEHSSRWGRAQLRGPSNDAICAALSHVKVPQLRRLEWSLPPPANPASFEFSTSLREICVPQDESGLWPRALPLSSLVAIPWHQITKYRATVTATIHLDVLRRAPALRECGLLLSGRPNNGLSTALVELPQLRRLHVEESSVLSHLIAPAVHDLFLKQFLPCVLPFIQRSGANLTSLHILHWTPSLDLISVLRANAGINHLCFGLADTVEGRDHLREFLALLGDTGSDLCPSLRSVMWRDGSYFKSYQDIFLSMVESRWRARRLKFLRLLVPACRIDPQIAQRLEAVGNDGLDWLVLCAWSFSRVVDAP